MTCNVTAQKKLSWPTCHFDKKREMTFNLDHFIVLNMQCEKSSMENTFLTLWAFFCFFVFFYLI